MIMTRNSKTWQVRGGVLAAVGLALAGASLPAAAAEAPSLGAARSFAVLGASTVSSTGATAVTGDVGVSPGTAVVGFPPATVADGAIHAGDATAATAHADAVTAYGILAGMASLPSNNLSDLDLGGRTLAPGVWKFNGAAELTGDLVLDAGGDSGAVFVFQIGTTLTTAGGSTVTVINGGADYDESKVFWQVGESATLGGTTAFTGNILAYASVTLVTGASMVGNALALNGGVTLDGNVVVSPTLVVEPPPPFIAAPVALMAVLAGPAGSQGANLSWTDGSDNETEFRVYRRAGASGGFLLIDTVVAADMVGTDLVVTRNDPLLAVSTTFSYRVTAFNAVDGESLPSNTVQVHTDPAVSTGRPSGARSILLPPDAAADQDAVGRLFVKHFPANSKRADRTWFKLKLRHLDADTEFTLWANDPATVSNELVQMDTFTTKRSGNYNYTKDTKKGAVVTFGAAIASLGGTAVEVRNSTGTVVILVGTIPATNP